jgi:hypothetical protein
MAHCKGNCQRNILALIYHVNHQMKDIHLVTSKPTVCPVCGSKRIAEYLFGMPAFSKELEKEVEEGKIILGGCVTTNNDPNYACMDCRTDFYRSFDW